MSTAIAIREDREELIRVLQSSLYVGAKAESVDMVVTYCETAHLDVMQKPVHIVPMNTRDPVSGKYEWRDTIMPGIGFYRIQAARSTSRELVGISEPEFGPEVTRSFTDKNGAAVTVTFPEWCRITVKAALPSGVVGEFVGYEYWDENYATDSGKSDAPNAMWRKRRRGQLAKCAEAQALRKAFPEVGQAPTAEEMEGKVIERDMGDAQVVTDRQPAALPDYPEDQFDTNFPKWRDMIDSGKKTADQIIAMVSSKYRLSDKQANAIKADPSTGEIIEHNDHADFYAEMDRAQELAQ